MFRDVDVPNDNKSSTDHCGHVMFLDVSVLELYGPGEVCPETIVLCDRCVQDEEF